MCYTGICRHEGPSGDCTFAKNVPHDCYLGNLGPVIKLLQCQMRQKGLRCLKMMLFADMQDVRQM